MTAQVLQALNAIRGSATIPYELQISPPPEGETIAYDLANSS